MVVEPIQNRRESTHLMTLYHQLMHSGNPQAAAQMVISLLEKHSPNQVAELMGITVRWVYTLKKRFRDANGNLASCFLKRGPAAPMPNRTPLHIEKLVVSLAKETNLGPQRLSVLLLQSAGLSLSPYTIRNILRRDQVRCRKYKSVNGNRRYAANLAEFCPLEFWQIDAKHIADQSALPKEAYAAIFKNSCPNTSLLPSILKPDSALSPMPIRSLSQTAWPLCCS